jgi:L-arabinokinase
MGYRIIADLAGFACKRNGDRHVEIEDNRWHGYLCNISTEEYRQYEREIPLEIGGWEFLRKYGGTTDQVTTVQADKSYAVRPATEHAVLENCRVNEFSDLLRSEPNVQQLDRMGGLMFASHASYAACGLTEPGTDLLVKLVRERRSEGLFGAHITGGGSGGTVAVLSSRNNEAVIQRIASEYESETGRYPYIFHGSSPGSTMFGSIVLEKS